ncbi:MAG: hypothetical protein A2X36_14830 [Elusimicrobia bacterium GWA2_69_24]|nr:MAG: hypothetical protein A2X36_14830 [Elusimicrobia bacterium GWA2_69_24]HBL19172.1 peptidylprolyl isomerase [Elusimicrobiota bacterium]
MRMIAVLSILLAAPLWAADAPSPAAVVEPVPAASAFQTDEEKVLYALGVSMGGRIGMLSLTPADMKTVEIGFRDGALGKEPQVEMNLWGPKINEMARTRVEAKAAKEKEDSKASLEKAGKEKGAKVTASGLIFKDVKAGKGASPKPEDTVKVHYHGTLISGKVFDSSVLRGEPAEFPVNRVVPCWTEALQLMKVGGKAKLVCPSKIAYGDMGSPPDIPGGATLIFEVELLEILKPQQ